jgi:hypothetical protein
MAKDVEHFFMYLLDIFTSFENCVFSSFSHLFVGFLILCGFSFLSFLNILLFYLVKCIPGKDLPFCRLSPSSSDSFLCRNFIVRYSSTCEFFLIIAELIGILLRMLLPMHLCSSVFPILSCNYFRFRSYNKIFDPL